MPREVFGAHRDVKCGRSNPERMDNPYWEAMVRCQGDAYLARKTYDVPFKLSVSQPIWCFARMGYARVVLNDHTMIFIGGEHEDCYDPDFAIYNDVVVRRWDGSIEIYGYPPGDFMPTDFHTATHDQDEDLIYIVGCRGYAANRIVGETPVHVLELGSMVIRRLEVKGVEPSWLNSHQAIYWHDEKSILVWGGEVMPDQDRFVANRQMWAFSLVSRTWRKFDAVELREEAFRWWMH